MINLYTVGAGLSRDCTADFNPIRVSRIFHLASILLLASLTFSSAQDIRSSLALGDRSGSPNTSISVPIQIASNGGLVGLQFDVLFNSTIIDITSVTPGTLSTDHTIVSQSVESGRQRLLIYSKTNTELENGILGDLELDLSGNFTGEHASLSLSNVSFVTANGTVLSVDIAPFVQLTDPSENVAANELSSLNLSAVAIANSGEVTRVEFQADGRTIGFDTEGPYSVAWAVDAPGNVLVTAVAIDVNGNRGTSTGVLVNVTASPFLETWRQANFNEAQRTDPGISGFNSDPDGDGVINFFELAFGLNPLIADLSGMPKVDFVEENGMRYLALRYQRPAGMADLIYTVEISGDLSNWLSTAVAVSEKILETSGGLETILAQTVDPIEEKPVFIRVRIAPANL